MRVVGATKYFSGTEFGLNPPEESRAYVLVSLNITNGSQHSENLYTNGFKIVANGVRVPVDTSATEKVCEELGVKNMGWFLGTLLDPNEDENFILVFQPEKLTQELVLEVSRSDQEQYRVDLAPYLAEEVSSKQLVPTPTHSSIPTATPVATLTPFPAATHPATYTPVAEATAFPPRTPPQSVADPAQESSADEPEVQSNVSDAIVPGSVGSTREEALKSWNIDESGGLVVESTLLDHTQYAVYDTRDMRYQIYILFELQDDDQPRATDRVLEVSVSLIKFLTVAEGERMLETLMPRDAEPIGEAQTNSLDDNIQMYRSSALESVFPGLDGTPWPVGPPGTVWATIGMVGDKVGAIEMSVFDPSN